MNTATIDSNDDVGAIIVAFRAELPDAAAPLLLLVRFEVAERDGAKVAAAFGRARPLTQNEPGCLVFDLNQEVRAPGRFVVYERWRSLADLEAHLRTDYVARLRAELDEMMVGTPEFRALLPVV